MAFSGRALRACRSCKRARARIQSTRASASHGAHEQLDFTSTQKANLSKAPQRASRLTPAQRNVPASTREVLACRVPSWVARPTRAGRPWASLGRAWQTRWLSRRTDHSRWACRAGGCGHGSNLCTGGRKMRRCGARRVKTRRASGGARCVRAS